MDVGEVSRMTANVTHCIVNARDGRHIAETEEKEEFRASVAEDTEKRKTSFSIFRDANEESPSEFDCLKLQHSLKVFIAKTESPLEYEHE